MSLSATLENLKFQQLAATEDSWTSLVEILHGRKQVDAGQLAADLATCGLSTEQMADFARRVDRAKALRAIIATREARRAEHNAAAEVVAAAKARLKETVKQLEQEEREARSTMGIAAARLEAIGNAEAELERLEKSHPHLLAGGVPDFIQQQMDKCQRNG